MTVTIESDIWCDLALHWIARNGIDGLDSLQRSRFNDHASRCQRCAAYLVQDAEAETADGKMATAAEWPHLADETLRLMVKSGLSQSEQTLIQESFEPHLQGCDYCADRLAAMEEWPEVPESYEAVVGRAVTEAVRWEGEHAELGWVIDQPATGLCLWSVSLVLTAGELEARLEVKGSNIPEAWRFSLPLATDEELLPTLVFTPDARVVRFACEARTEANWWATPLLTMPLPSWSPLVSAGEDPATMVSLDDSKRLQIALRVPYEGPREKEAIVLWLDTLLVDLVGERLTFAEVRGGSENELTGSVFNRMGRKAGAWTLRFLESRVIDLLVVPANAEILRFATETDGQLSLDTVALDSEEAVVHERRTLRFPRISAARTRIDEVAALGLAADGAAQLPLEEGRRFLVRGRHQFVLRTSDHRAIVELEERDSRLWVRFLEGSPLRVITTSEPLGASWQFIVPTRESTAETALANSLEWIE